MSGILRRVSTDRGIGAASVAISRESGEDEEGDGEEEEQAAAAASRKASVDMSQ